MIKRTLVRLARRGHPTLRLVDARLGASGDDRPPLHERLDRLEHYGSHIAEQNDKTIRELHALVTRIEQSVHATVAAERAYQEETLDAIAERLGRLEALLLDADDDTAPLARRSRDDDGAARAFETFAAAALGDLRPAGRVLACGTLAVPVALGLAARGHEVVIETAVVDDVPHHPLVRPVPTLDVVAGKGRAFHAAVVYVDRDRSGSTAPRRAALVNAAAEMVDGPLVLGMPSGTDSFDPSGLDALPGGWAVHRQENVSRSASGAWVAGAGGGADTGDVLALLVVCRSSGA